MPRSIPQKSDTKIVMTVVTRYLLVEQELPLSMLAEPKPLNIAVNSGFQFKHLALNVKDKRFLAEVGLNDLPGGLQPDHGVQLVGHVRKGRP